MFIWALLGWGVLPRNPVEILTAVLPIWVSVLAGRRVRDRRPGKGWRALLVLVNTGGAIVMIAIFVFLQGRYESQGGASAMPVSSAYASDTGGTTNIFPYSKDGKPLHDVLLYDQNGQPLLVNYGQGGEELTEPCGGPPLIANSYPLPLQENTSGDLPGPDGQPCSSPTPSISESPPVSVSPTPQISQPSGRPIPSPSPSHG